MLSKNTHKDQIGSKPGKRGKSGQFFDSIWYRLHDKSYTGRDCSEAVEVAIDLILNFYRKVTTSVQTKTLHSSRAINTSTLSSDISSLSSDSTVAEESII